MLLVGDALFVAGELDIMVFDMRVSTSGGTQSNPASSNKSNSSSNATPPPHGTTAAGMPRTVGSCGAPCAAVGKAKGQNFHSLSHRYQGGRHLLFLSAQIDNVIGCVELLDPNIIALLLQWFIIQYNCAVFWCSTRQYRPYQQPILYCCRMHEILCILHQVLTIDFTQCGWTFWPQPDPV